VKVKLAPINYKLIHIHKLKGFPKLFCILPLFGPGILVPYWEHSSKIILYKKNNFLEKIFFCILRSF
jgi:hypothetical protein